MRLSAAVPLGVLPLALTGCGGSSGPDVPKNAWLAALVKEKYPPQYVAQKLGSGESIIVDGNLDDEAWKNVPFTTQAFDDLAQLRFPNYTVPGQNYTKVKVRWDANYLYVGAELGEAYVTGTVTGHNSYLSTTRGCSENVPYFDNDFEIFIDASMSNWYYKEFEMNYLNATYDVLWRAPDDGLGSVGIPCNQSSEQNWCQNTTFTATSAGGPDTWTMFNRNAADPGMESATALIDGGWSLEIKFPLRGNGDHGGLTDAEPGVDVTSWDPNAGAKYWWADFSRAEHPYFNYWLDSSNCSNADIKPLCQEVMDSSPQLLGLDKWSCYWEWTWADVGGHQYMHNPDNFGFLQFTSEQNEEMCGNVEWPVRFFLAQIYQAQVQHVKANGNYAEKLEDLLANATSGGPKYCTLENGCYASKLQIVLDNPTELQLAFFVNNSKTTCVDYSASAPTGGPCFRAALSYMIDGHNITGEITESRRMQVHPHDSTCLAGVSAPSDFVAVYA